MAKNYKVCWWYPRAVDVKYYGKQRKPTCRTLSADQHRSAREAAETVLMQNSGAYVRVVSPNGGGRGTVFKARGGRYSGISSVVKTNLRDAVPTPAAAPKPPTPAAKPVAGWWPFAKKKPKKNPMSRTVMYEPTKGGGYVSRLGRAKRRRSRR